MLPVFSTLLKSIKDIGFGQVLGTGVLIQSLATQQIISEHSQSNTQELEAVTKERVFDNKRNDIQEQYWEDLNEVMDFKKVVAAKGGLIRPEVKLVQGLLEEPALAPPTPSSPISSQNSLVVAVAEGPTVNDSSSSRHTSIENTAKRRAPSSVASNVNGAIEPLADKIEKEENRITQKEIASKSIRSEEEEKRSSVPSSNSESEVDDQDTGGEDQTEEETEDENEPEREFTHLTTVGLYDREGVLVSEIANDGVIQINPAKNYTIIVNSEEEPGSVTFRLEDLDSLRVINENYQNQVPFALYGDRGDMSSLVTSSFGAALYQLDLSAHQGNGGNGLLLEERRVTFTLSYE